MAARTIDVAPYFAVGTTLNAYEMTAANPDGAAPSVAATASAVVAATGLVSFAGLADGSRYWVGTGASPYNYIEMWTPSPAGSVDGADATARASIAAHIADTADAHDATAISFTPVGSLSATTVQAAIVEAAAEATGAPGPAGPPGTVDGTSGVVVVDRTTAAPWLIYVDNGVLSIEEYNAGLPSFDQTGLVGWYRFAELTGAADAPFSTVPDKSAAGNGLVLAPSASAPTLVPAGIGGKPSLFFAAGQGLATPAGILPGAHTVYAVYQTDDLTANQRRAVQGLAANWLIGPVAGTFGHYDEVNFTPGAPTLSTSPVIVSVSTPTGVEGPSVYRVNGALIGSTARSVPVGGLVIGAGAGSPPYFEALLGQVSQVLAFTGAHNTARMQEVEAYLAADSSIVLA